MDETLPAEIDEGRWNEACRRADAIRDCLRRYPQGAKAADVSDLADELELSRASSPVYRGVACAGIGQQLAGEGLWRKSHTYGEFVVRRI